MCALIVVTIYQRQPTICLLYSFVLSLRQLIVGTTQFAESYRSMRSNKSTRILEQTYFIRTEEWAALTRMHLIQWTRCGRQTNICSEPTIPNIKPGWGACKKHRTGVKMVESDANALQSRRLMLRHHQQKSLTISWTALSCDPNPQAQSGNKCARFERIVILIHVVKSLPLQVALLQTVKPCLRRTRCKFTLNWCPNLCIDEF